MFQPSELNVLSLMFKELEGKDHRMDKSTFLKFFKVPGMLGERLFSVFDSGHDGAIDYGEFINGLARYARGTKDQRIRMIFEMYDLNNDRTISRADLSLMLHSLVDPHIMEQQERTLAYLKSFRDPAVSRASVRRRRAADRLALTTRSSADSSAGVGDSTGDGSPAMRLDVTRLDRGNSNEENNNDDVGDDDENALDGDGNDDDDDVDESLLTDEERRTRLLTQQLHDPYAGPINVVHEVNTAAMIGSDEEKVVIERIVNYAFDSCDVDKQNSLCYTNFVRWLDQNPCVVAAIEAVFENNCWVDPRSATERKAPSRQGNAGSPAPGATGPVPGAVNSSFNSNPGTSAHAAVSTSGHNKTAAAPTSSGAVSVAGTSGTAGSVSVSGKSSRSGSNTVPADYPASVMATTVTTAIAGAPTAGAGTVSTSGHSVFAPTTLSTAPSGSVALNYTPAPRGSAAAFTRESAVTTNGRTFGPGSLPPACALTGAAVCSSVGADAGPQPLICRNCGWGCRHCHLCGSALRPAHDKRSYECSNDSTGVCPGFTTLGNIKHCMQCGQPMRSNPLLLRLDAAVANANACAVGSGTTPVAAPAVLAAAMGTGGAFNSATSTPVGSPLPDSPAVSTVGELDFRVMHREKPAPSASVNAITLATSPGAVAAAKAAALGSATAGTTPTAQSAAAAAAAVAAAAAGQAAVHAAQQHVSFEGALYKRAGSLVKHWKQRWVLVRDSFIYFFKEREAIDAKFIIFLDGCFIELPEEDEYASERYYGFEIITRTHKHTVYTRTVEERRAWVRALRLAAKTQAVEEFYDLGRAIGKGKFAVVYEARQRASGKLFAIKVVSKSMIESNQQEQEALRAEIAILKLMSHPNVINMKEVFEDHSNIYIVMPLVPHGDLFDRIMMRKVFSEKVARVIAWRLLSALDYLHERGIVHRDLKPENILMLDKTDDTKVVLADFGLSIFACPQEVLKLNCGTISYVAPEVLLLKGYSKMVDMWGLGVIVFVLLSGELPFQGRTQAQVIHQTLYAPLSFTATEWQTVSPEARDFVTLLLQKLPSSRPTSSAAMAHPWFASLRKDVTPAVLYPGLKKSPSTDQFSRIGSVSPSPYGLPNLSRAPTQEPPSHSSAGIPTGKTPVTNARTLSAHAAAPAPSPSPTPTHGSVSGASSSVSAVAGAPVGSVAALPSPAPRPVGPSSRTQPSPRPSTPSSGALPMSAVAGAPVSTIAPVMPATAGSGPGALSAATASGAVTPRLSASGAPALGITPQTSVGIVGGAPVSVTASSLAQQQAALQKQFDSYQVMVQDYQQQLHMYQTQQQHVQQQQLHQQQAHAQAQLQQQQNILQQQQQQLQQLLHQQQQQQQQHPLLHHNALLQTGSNSSVSTGLSSFPAGPHVLHSGADHPQLHGQQHGTPSPPQQRAFSPATPLSTSYPGSSAPSSVPGAAPILGHAAAAGAAHGGSHSVGAVAGAHGTLGHSNSNVVMPGMVPPMPMHVPMTIPANLSGSSTGSTGHIAAAPTAAPAAAPATPAGAAGGATPGVPATPRSALSQAHHVPIQQQIAQQQLLLQQQQLQKQQAQLAQLQAQAQAAAHAYAATTQALQQQQGAPIAATTMTPASSATSTSASAFFPGVGNNGGILTGGASGATSSGQALKLNVAAPALSPITPVSTASNPPATGPSAAPANAAAVSNNHGAAVSTPSIAHAADGPLASPVLVTVTPVELDTPDTPTPLTRLNAAHPNNSNSNAAPTAGRGLIPAPISTGLSASSLEASTSATGSMAASATASASSLPVVGAQTVAATPSAVSEAVSAPSSEPKSQPQPQAVSQSQPQSQMLPEPQNEGLEPSASALGVSFISADGDSA